MGEIEKYGKPIRYAEPNDNSSVALINEVLDRELGGNHIDSFQQLLREENERRALEVNNNFTLEERAECLRMTLRRFYKASIMRNDDGELMAGEFHDKIIELGKQVKETFVRLVLLDDEAEDNIVVQIAMDRFQAIDSLDYEGFVRNMNIEDQEDGIQVVGANQLQQPNQQVQQP